MPRTPIDLLLDAISWIPFPHQGGQRASELPYATHEGVLHIGELALKVYQLSDGRRVIEHDDLLRFFGPFVSGPGGQP